MCNTSLTPLLIVAMTLSCLLPLGCATDNAGDGRGFTARDNLLRGADRYPREGLIIVKADLNQDSIPDVYSIYQEDGGDKPTRKLFRKEIDVNFDGSIDIWRHYDRAESLNREELDYNFDGRVDAINHFDNGELVRKEIDVEFDQAPDVFKYYRNGALLRIERDTDNNGQIDYWEFYERGVLDRIGRDLSGDGKADSWEER